MTGAFAVSELYTMLGNNPDNLAKAAALWGLWWIRDSIGPNAGRSLGKDCLGIGVVMVADVKGEPVKYRTDPHQLEPTRTHSSRVNGLKRNGWVLFPLFNGVLTLWNAWKILDGGYLKRGFGDQIAGTCVIRLSRAGMTVIRLFDRVNEKRET
jgi:hypothetical protein